MRVTKAEIIDLLVELDYPEPVRKNELFQRCIEAARELHQELEQRLGKEPRDILSLRQAIQAICLQHDLMQEQLDCYRTEELIRWVEQAARATGCDSEQMTHHLWQHHGIAEEKARKLVQELGGVELGSWLQRRTLTQLRELLGVDEESALSLLDAVRDMRDVEQDTEEDDG